MTPGEELVEAARAGNADEVRRLLAEGVWVDDVNRHGETALMQVRTAEMVELLVAAGADMHATVPYGRTPLSEALGRQAVEVVAALARAGCDLERKDEHGLTPLVRFCSTGEVSPASVSALLAAGANLQASAKTGRTALHYAAQLFSGDRFGKLGAVARVLVAAGLPVDVRDHAQATPLMLAVGDEGCDLGVVRTLLELGADVNARTRYGTPLMQAVSCYYARAVVPLLLAAGADLTARHRSGETALERALEHQRTWEGIAARRVRGAGTSQREHAEQLQRDQVSLSECREVVAILRAAWPAAVTMPELAPRQASPATPPVASGRSPGELFDALESFVHDSRHVPELAQADPQVVAQAGLARYPLKSTEARAALLEALGRLTDLAPVRAALLALWTPADGRGPAWYRGFGAIDELFKAVAKDPEVVDFLARDLFATDARADDRRATVVELLARSHSAVAARALTRHLHEQPGSNLRIVPAFVELGRPEPWPLVLLQLAEQPWSWRHGGLEALVACGGKRAVPYLLQGLDSEECARDLVPLLEPFPGSAVDAKLADLCAHPDGELRLRAALVLLSHLGEPAVDSFVGVMQTLQGAGRDIPFARWDQAAQALHRGRGLDADAPREHPGTSLDGWRAWLAARHRTPRTLPPLPPPLERLTARSQAAREEAMAVLHRQRDPSHLLALALAETLHDEITIGRGEIDWDGWSHRIPPEVLADRKHRLLPWLVDPAANLPAQSVPELLAEIPARGLDAAVALLRRRDPGFALRLEPEQREALRAELLRYLATP